MACAPENRSHIAEKGGIKVEKLLKLNSSYNDAVPTV